MRFSFNLFKVQEICKSQKFSPFKWQLNATSSALHPRPSFQLHRARFIHIDVGTLLFVVVAELVRLQAAVGPARVRRRRDAARALGPHLAARHRPLQQVRI
jgi:hypothetical protein